MKPRKKKASSLPRTFSADMPLSADDADRLGLVADADRLRAALGTVPCTAALPANAMEQLVQRLLQAIGRARTGVLVSKGGAPFKVALIGLLADLGEAMAAVGLPDSNWHDFDTNRKSCKHQIVRALGPVIPMKIPADLRKLDAQAWQTIKDRGLITPTGAGDT